MFYWLKDNNLNHWDLKLLYKRPKVILKVNLKVILYSYLTLKKMNERITDS